MRLPQRNKFGGGGEVNITPLCDIMLSLLIFFMLVSKAGLETGADEAIELPITTLATEEELEEADLANTAVLNVYGNPGTDLTTVTTLGPLGETLTLDIGGGKDDLTPYLREAAGDSGDFTVILRAGRGTEYRYVEPVLLAAAEAGVATINTAVAQEDE